MTLLACHGAASFLPVHHRITTSTTTTMADRLERISSHGDAGPRLPPPLGQPQRPAHVFTNNPDGGRGPQIQLSWGSRMPVMPDKLKLRKRIDVFPLRFVLRVRCSAALCGQGGRSWGALASASADGATAAAANALASSRPSSALLEPAPPTPCLRRQTTAQRRARSRTA